SSESRNAIKGARAAETPRFRAAAGPQFRDLTIRIGSCATADSSAKLDNRAAVSSVEPSSTMISSRSTLRWALTEATASPSIGQRLKVGITTLTSVIEKIQLFRALPHPAASVTSVLPA